MAYNKINWQNGEDAQTTPVNAENLNHMDNQIEANATEIDDIERLGAFGISASGRTLSLKNKNGETIASATTQDTTYTIATTSKNGLMSSADKTKLDGIDGNYVRVLYTGTFTNVADASTSPNSARVDVSNIAGMDGNYPVTIILEGIVNVGSDYKEFSETIGFTKKKINSATHKTYEKTIDVSMMSDVKKLVLVISYSYDGIIYIVPSLVSSDIHTIKYLRVRILNI